MIVWHLQTVITNIHIYFLHMDHLHYDYVLNSVAANEFYFYRHESICYLYRKLSDINLHVQAQPDPVHVHLYTVISTAPFFFHNFQSKSSAVHPSWGCMDVVSTQEDGQCRKTKAECWDGNRSSSHLTLVGT